MDKALNRRLAAILVADIVGYSRLMGADEAGTLRRLKALRRELVDPRIAAAGGRIVKTTGDGLVVEFPSPLRAVSCAVAIQKGMLTRDAGTPEDRVFRLRIGINVGDVVAEPDGDLYGDGVNVAARLEPLAEPGGICISRSVHDQVRDKLRYPFEDRGEQELRNIARPLGVFALPAAVIPSLPETDEEPGPGRAERPLRRVALASGLVALLAAGGLGWWLSAPARPPVPNPGALPAAAAVNPAPRLSLVVLPFTNLSNDPEQDFFADAITEDLTTDVSHLADSFVIARNTAFTYKGKPVDVKQIGRDLGVRYVLEGSVRRTGENVVLNAQLISAETGAHLWADRFDGERGRLGDLQVEFVARLARSLDVQLTQAESLRSLRERPTDPGASDLAMRGWAALNKPRSLASNNEAQDYFERALALDPTLPRAILGLSRALITKPSMSWSRDKDKDIKDAEDLIDKYLASYPGDAVALVVKGDVFRARRQFDSARSMYEAAIAGNRNYAMAQALKGHVSTLTGKASEAISSELQAIRLSPRDPLLNVWYYFVCHAHTHQRHWDEAITWCNKSVALSPYWLSSIDLAAAYAWQGRQAEARAAVAEILKLMPGYTVQKWANAGWSDNPVFLEEYQYVVEGLRKAGLPEN
ncbi:adenylate/guanylate cyclase [Methylobacterium sp. 4-46]|uniref:adenylate/guanylate cyclase domain-containing protein n=1 Tax=unclassified Methylobacterium TaxID=2615210 RepID=UPI000152E7CE|nr:MULTISPECIES: adenylate/guanylate cyclase domain-containing protein [Methylobacterium]ACA15096.1 adenylate/guanylate cyclase [Methylobacterium sp. 4-46]WFT80830.1 adenylate/guanylate cyclase domain-containing protein [Methylobacterium nodulans]